MKLASLKNGRDGRLVVVARDLSRYIDAAEVAPTLQAALDALEDALRYRLYATVNPQALERPNEGTLVFKMLECRVQSARRRKGLPDFACKPVGTAEYATFAATIDARISARCLQCPPDRTDGTGYVCGWGFTMSAT